MKYAYDIGEEKEVAKAYGRSLPISVKTGAEICSKLRGKKVKKAKDFLEKVIAMKVPVEMSRFNKDRGHKPGKGPARYPVKATGEILNVLKSAESNASDKGLDANDLIITHISVHKASRPYRYGRKRRRKMKRSHVQIVVVAENGKGDSEVKKI